MTRRFEYVGGGSAKFWEVERAGVEVIVRYGRLGTKGQIQTKSFPTAEAARQHVESLVAKKLVKGYIECAAV